MLFSLTLGTLLGILLATVLLSAKHKNFSLSQGHRVLDLVQRKIASDFEKLKCLSHVQCLTGIDIQTPCEAVILQAEAANQKNGHENLGSLSFQGGFVPLDGPITCLPKRYAPWDDLAAQLPQLIKAQNLQNAINQLPLLEVHQLPDRYLQRAASVIGILSHAYVRLDGQHTLRTKVGSHTEILPAVLYVPWTQICNRLGRSSTSLSFIDLVLYNFTTTATYREDMNIENSKLLLPTVNNVEEQTFYGVMTETSAKAIPVMRDVVEAHKSVLMDDNERLAHSLRRLVSQIRQITRTISKLNAKRIDPVIWTKTVANLAIPWVDGLVGSAGTAHPFFHLMDEFIERHNYDTRVGKEALEVRSHFPKHWKEFISATRQVSVSRYIEAKNKAELSHLWQSLKDVYIGDEGLLGFHRRKVYGFLAISFRIGRNSTINGLGAQTARKSCNHVNKELEQSRVERPRSSEKAIFGMQCKSAKASNEKSCQQIRLHELIQHNNETDGFWFTAHGKVYDATPFMTAHPGGKHVIAILSGQDATKDLNTVAHLSNPSTKSLLDRYEIGSIYYQCFSSSIVDKIYDSLVQLAYKITEIESVYHKTTSFITSQMTSADLAYELSALKTKHFLESMAQLRGCYNTSLINSLEILGGFVEAQSSSVEIQSAMKALISNVEQQTNEPMSSPSGRESNQTLITWETAVDCVKQNCELLHQIKALIIDMLVDYERMDADIDRLSEQTFYSLAEGLVNMKRYVTQLGRQPLNEVFVQ